MKTSILFIATALSFHSCAIRYKANLSRLTRKQYADASVIQFTQIEPLKIKPIKPFVLVFVIETSAKKESLIPDSVIFGNTLQ